MGKNWAIVVGINNYDNLQSLNYAKRDAEAMKAWFEDEAQFDQVFLFTEDSPAIVANPPIPTQPTQARFKRFLNAQFEEPLLKPEDNLWFFFAGHGKRFIDQDYLMFLDSDPTDYTTSISVDYVTQRLRRCGADNVVLLIDACRDEGDRSGLGVGMQEHKGVITFYSCAPSQKSWEIDELQHGSFTYSLLEGLRIQGEANCATVERLEQHLRYRVPQLNADYKRSVQNPALKAEPPYKMYYILLEQVATIKDVEPLKYQASLAENRANFSLAEQLWTRVLVVSRADTEAIEAFKRIGQYQEQASISSNSIFESLLITQPVISLEGEMSGMPEPLLVQESKATPADKNEPTVNSLLARSHIEALSNFDFEFVTVNAQGQIINRQKGQARYLTENLGKGVKLDMVFISSGHFFMGSPDATQQYENQQPYHKVIIQPFFLGKHQVTQAQWKAVVALPEIDLKLNAEPSFFKGDNRPVESISWYEANEFCQRLSKYTEHKYRLPSEAEWEYACRAKTVTPFHFGETLTMELANYLDSQVYKISEKGKYIGKTTTVMTFLPNSFGLYDMHGNIREWCFDQWHDNYHGAPSNGCAWVISSNHSHKVLRGGSCVSRLEDCRSSNRYKDVPSNNNYGNGFRIASSI